MNGPYLLAPTAAGITICWETDLPVTATVWYGTDDQLADKLTVTCERGAPWQENAAGICMYRAVLTGLQPDTYYNYKVELSSGELKTGSFKTLKENPEEIYLYTISDSHAFATHRDFAASVEETQPDFVIHSGDIPLGTGYQKDHFAALWFQSIPELLSRVPVVYIDGNHDAGPYFHDYFMQAQLSAYHPSPNGLNFSFDYGHTHFVMVNSNPWGLYEMNAVMSKLAVDEKTERAITASLQWLVDDLTSAAARKASWRVVVMHHPYTDNFANKRIVKIVEENNVNLVLGGHLHFYQKNVSVDPNVGANILYIAQGSAQDPAGKIEYGDPERRILADFPEVIAMGKAMYSTLQITAEKLIFKTYGRSDETGPRLLDETVLVQEKPRLRLSDVVFQELDNTTVGFTGTVKNEGEGLAAVTVKVWDNERVNTINLFGNKGQERVVALNPGEVRTINGCIPLYSPGRHAVRIGGVSRVFEVAEPDTSFELKNMNLQVGCGQESNVIFASAEITNLQFCSQAVEVNLFVGAKVVQTQRVVLQAHEIKTVNFAHRFSYGGTYRVAIGELAAREVQIEGVLQATPLVRDLSGHGNHGLIRGTPLLNRLTAKTLALDLQDYGDYIEIPDNPSLHLRDGFSGMVWANLERVAREGEKDHHPLMVKGPSVGWGANYLLRMVVRKIGVVAWGTCHDITEYAWDGGQAQIGQWAQYTSTFNRATGGASYIAGQKTAEIAGISSEAVLRYWEGHPIFVGYSGIGHVIKELNRPKYFTHLPGQISQIRFYATKLSAAEVQYINEHPDEAGPRSEDMRVWLNFRDIETKGTHVTEWRRPRQFKPAFKADKQLWGFQTMLVDSRLPGAALLQTTIEVSDDQETIKGSRQITLAGGRESIDISDLPQAQYIRLKTTFTACVGLDGTDIPELHAYTITAVREDKQTRLIWGTRADWERGSLTGAIGFVPLNRTKVIEEYTDVIH